MSQDTAIEWATHTFNPWIGCTKVSPGCAHCYAEQTTRARVLRSQGQETWGKGAKRSRTSAATWRQPMKWNREAGELLWACTKCNADVERNWEDNERCWKCKGSLFSYEKDRPRVFPSLCDWLDDEVPIEWLADFLKLIHDTPNLDWLLLTKRPENWKVRILEVRAIAANSCLDEDKSLRPFRDWLGRWIEGSSPANVWIGTSVEDQNRADERIPELLKIPAKVRFLSVEPLLGAVDLAYTCFNGADSFGTMPGIHWAIVGGESGPGARPCNVDWIRDIVRQCKAAGVSCFVKQLGSRPTFTHAQAGDAALLTREQAALADLLREMKHKKGGDPAEWPEDLRVREFPKS